jgi:hypothetical protein
MGLVRGNIFSVDLKKIPTEGGNIFSADLKKIPTEGCKPSGLEKTHTVWFIWKLLQELLCKQIYVLL